MHGCRLLLQSKSRYFLWADYSNEIENDKRVVDNLLAVKIAAKKANAKGLAPMAADLAAVRRQLAFDIKLIHQTLSKELGKTMVRRGSASQGLEAPMF